MANWPLYCTTTTAYLPVCIQMINYRAVHRRSPLAILQLSISIIQQHHAAQAEAIIKLHPQPQRQILPVVTTCHLQWNGSSFWQKRSGQVMHPSASTQSRHVFQLQFRASSIDTSRKYGRLLLMPMHSSSGTSGQVDILRTHYWHRLLRTCSQRQHRRPT